jgi:hypothetical protein
VGKNYHKNLFFVKRNIMKKVELKIYWSRNYQLLNTVESKTNYLPWILGGIGVIAQRGLV